MTKFGIINFCNNCYLNVIIQLFLSNKQTSNIIVHYLDFNERNIKNSHNNCAIINPKKLLMLLSKKMNVSRQNDSQEAFTQILDLLPDLEKHYKTKIQNSFKCLECNKIRTTIDTFSTFYIYGTSIEESVKQLITDEKFELECEHCKKNTETIKSCRIKSLGNVLVFYNVTKQKIKFTEFITYNNNKYKLTGIIKHFGNQRSGHYIYIDYINELIIDDTLISKIDNFKNLELDNIYLLFYTC
jgi:ubiquitin C-terminal hydrolase